MMQGSVRALKVVPSYTVQIVHEMGSNSTQTYTHIMHVRVKLHSATLSSYSYVIM